MCLGRSSLAALATAPKPIGPVEASEPCVEADAALSRAFVLLGKRWNAVILGVLANGPAGFAEVSRAIGHISDSMLSSRLSELTKAGLIGRVVDEGPPVSVAYSLTPNAKALIPALMQIAEWATQNLAE